MINVESFILNKYTPYDGDECFLSDTTDRTKYLLNQVNKLLTKERLCSKFLQIRQRETIRSYRSNISRIYLINKKNYDIIFI